MDPIIAMNLIHLARPKIFHTNNIEFSAYKIRLTFALGLKLRFTLTQFKRPSPSGV